MNWQEWGIWRSFNTVEDKVLGTLCLVIVVLLIIQIWHALRPQCCVCGKIDWFWKFTVEVTGGSGPETVETGHFCKRCTQ